MMITTRPEYLSTDGVYRQSGNLSVVQRLRLQIDQGNLAVLDSVDDVHVLTGALKLFFRELQEPLIPWEVTYSVQNNSMNKYCIISKTIIDIPGCGEAACCCESAEQEGEAETVKGNNIQVPFFVKSFCFPGPPRMLETLTCLEFRKRFN